MINLLPESKKKKIEKERSYNLFTLLLLYFLIFLLFFAGTFYILHRISLDSLGKETELLAQEEAKFPDIRKREVVVKKINEVLPEIDAFYNKTKRVSPLFKEIYDLLPEKVHLTSFKFLESGAVSLTGSAESWDDLLEIERKLKERFVEVEYLPGSWTQISDISFTLTFKVPDE